MLSARKTIANSSIEVADMMGDMCGDFMCFECDEEPSLWPTDGKGIFARTQYEFCVCAKNYIFAYLFRYFICVACDVCE